MPDVEFSLSIDVEDTIARFRDRIPNLTRAKILQAMRTITIKLKFAVQEKIAETFQGGHSTFRPPHVHLIDAISTAAYEDGDEIIGWLGVDAEAVPYAWILERGGVIPPHRILPKTAGGLYFPSSTLRSFQIGESEHMSDYVLAFQVNHPGGRIAPYYYLLSVVADFSNQFKESTELAVIAAIMESEGTTAAGGLVKR